MCVFVVKRQPFKGRDTMLNIYIYIFFLRELYFIRLTSDNWFSEHDSSFVDVYIHVCVSVYFRSRSFSSENVRIKWDYKDTCSLLDYKVVLLLSDGNKEIFGVPWQVENWFHRLGFREVPLKSFASRTSLYTT